MLERGFSKAEDTGLTDMLVTLLLDRGDTYWEDTKFKEAAEDFEKITAYEPKKSQAYIKAANAYIELDQPERAQSILERGREITGNDLFLISFNEMRGKIEMNRGDFYILSAATFPSGSIESLIYKSDNPSIVDIDTDGTMLALESGIVTISVSNEYVEKTINVEVFESDLSVVELELGKSAQLEVRILPENKGKSVVFTADQNDLLTVTQNGVVTATTSGNQGDARVASVTVELDNLKKTINVKVRDSYTWKWSDKKVKLGKNWDAYTSDFQNTVPSCSGFTYHYTLSSKYPDGTDATVAANKLKGQTFYIDGYFENAGRKRIGSFTSGEVDQEISVDVTFDAGNLISVVDYPSISPPSGYEYFLYSRSVRITNLQYDG